MKLKSFGRGVDLVVRVAAGLLVTRLEGELDKLDWLIDFSFSLLSAWK